MLGAGDDRKMKGMISLVLECIDRLHVYSSAAHFADIARREAKESWKSILNSLYELLGIEEATFVLSLFMNLEAPPEVATGVLRRLRAPAAIAALIRGNRENCAQFSGSPDWFISRLERLDASSGILEVLHCVLVESPEALNIIKEGHIKSIISLLDKHGRNHKNVTESTVSFSANNEVPGIMRPSIFLDVSEGSAQYKKWYYELMVDHTEPFVTTEATHLCVSWASTEGYAPSPGGGEEWGGNGVGDDLFSYGFDGLHLWSGCIARTGMLPAWGRHGEFKFLPPPSYTPCYEAVLPKEKLKVEHSREYKQERTYTRDLPGPTVSLTQAAFTPIPVDTSQIMLPPHLERIRRKLVENVHELWVMNKIELGWQYGPVHNEIITIPDTLVKKEIVITIINTVFMEKLDVGVRKEVDSMGTSEIKYRDSVCYIQHINSGLWLTSQSVDVKSVRMVSIQHKLLLSRISPVLACRVLENLRLLTPRNYAPRRSHGRRPKFIHISARRITDGTCHLKHTFSLIDLLERHRDDKIRGLDALSKKVKASAVDLPIESVSLSLQDLIGYFHPPEEHLEHEDKWNRL
ncbi:Ryanodine receptor 2 [Camelus dromedarius]|uniref:Ryanodine receptor 2 n=1 Tax=Camelus dromedarius TaxID=9838 RepID=A0A5N4CT44_CAMDR|nr:Ryanodine receptor 2 [Camelus dromedarius]